ncbi:MAG: DUF2207 domain-containing protein, partial [Candidatus Thorarchaeota archaeon]
MGFDRSNRFYGALAFFIFIMAPAGFFFGQTPANVRYDNVTPFRDYGDSSTYRIENYEVDVYPQSDGTLNVHLLIEYYVLSGTKTRGFKQFLLPTPNSYIYGAEAYDGQSLDVHVTPDGMYIEVGWTFYSPFTGPKTVNVEFNVGNGVSQELFADVIRLPNAGRWGVSVSRSVYRVHLPDGAGLLSNVSQSVFEDHLITWDPPEVYATPFTGIASRFAGVLCIALTIICITGIIQTERSKVTLSPGNHPRPTSFPVGFLAAMKFGVSKAIWASLFAMEIYGKRESKASILPSRFIRGHEYVIAQSTGAA